MLATLLLALINNIPEVLKKDAISFEGIYQDAYGRHKPCFSLDRELTDKRHDNIKVSAERLAEKGVTGTPAVREYLHSGNVKLSAERLAAKGVITLPEIQEVSNQGPGPKIIRVYNLDKRSSLIVVAQLCPEFTARIVDRWQELEAQLVAPSFKLFLKFLPAVDDLGSQVNPVPRHQDQGFTLGQHEDRVTLTVLWVEMGVSKFGDTLHRAMRRSFRSSCG